MLKDIDYLNKYNDYMRGIETIEATKIPNELIRTNLKRKGLGRFFYVVYIMLHQKSTKDNDSLFVIKEMYDVCNLRHLRRKGLMVKEVIPVLKFLQDEGYIELYDYVYDIKFESFARVKLLDKFFPNTNYTLIRWGDFNKAMTIKSETRPIDLLLVIIYILSYINETSLTSEKNRAKATHISSERACKTVGMSNRTFAKSVDALTTGRWKVFQTEKHPYKFGKNVTFYALNEKGWEEEIKKLYTYYQIDDSLISKTELDTNGDYELRKTN